MIVYVLSLRHAQIAQLVEQWTENPRVTGSIPVLGTFFMPKNSIKRLWRVGCLHTKAHRHLMRKTHEQRRRQPICECCCRLREREAWSNRFLVIDCGRRRQPICECCCRLWECRCTEQSVFRRYSKKIRMEAVGSCFHPFFLLS